MDTRLSIPGEQRNPSIEAYKLGLQRLEHSITNWLTKQAPSHATEPSNSLCQRCTEVGQRLKDVSDITPSAEARDIALSGGSRDAVGNIHLETLADIFTQGDCALCTLITRQFIRAKRREIYYHARSQGQQLDGLSLGELLGLSYPEENIEDDEECWIEDPFSSVIQISLNTIVNDGRLSLWWPENVVDEINDEPAQLPMIAQDHQAIFKESMPWIPLPLVEHYNERGVSMFRNCFNTCMQNHADCKQKTPASRPSRLIDIHQMRVIHIEPNSTPAYFVLSYVWGKPPFLLLLKSNQSEFAKPGSLSTQAIPQTISEAIEITRFFGGQYLWVDALCIVQDDTNDKMSEIERMHEIYAQADLTIVAATGDGANSSLMDIDPVFGDECVHVIGGKRFTADVREMREVIEFSTWFTRGWTFQELVFSNRLLYFTTERTYFACAVGNWSVDLPFDEKLSVEEYQNTFFDEDPKLGFDFRNKLDPFENYSSMVSKISTRQFTKESDVLDACRGFYTGIILDELGLSVCGLPATCFEFALMWQPDGNLRRRRVCGDETPFPSWSWAGWAGAVDYPLLSGPGKFGVRCEITWAVLEVPESTNEDEECVLEQVFPTTIARAPNSMEGNTSWMDTASHAEITSRQRRYGTRKFKVSNPASENAKKDANTPSSFIGPSILTFKTTSITCSLIETVAPVLSALKNLKHFSIFTSSPFSPTSHIGELKIDTATITTLSSSKDVDLDSVELISLFSMNFSSQAMKDLLWMNSLSKIGIFSKEFVDMVESREDEDRWMKAVMWIVWEQGIARRVAVGWVSEEGFKGAGARKKEIVLG
ncbi:related to tol protein [Phialocephala subalpina]|uniref:Related to tol protein n=1 Tax=Phialocephala subalpina TaxID=576137 RepID=A0A1L7XNL9_9HELO|nr:related to tol protein [Phialocephala subalpina]